MKYKIFSWLLIVPVFFGSLAIATSAQAASGLKGSIYSASGQTGVWYLNTDSEQRVNLSSGKDAYNLMRWEGLGISNNNIAKISVEPSTYQDSDSDNDGLANRIEDALGTDKMKSDTDGDGHDDLTEVKNNYNPLGIGNMPINNSLARSLAGKILLQVEARGEAWYIHPTTYKRHYLGSGENAYDLFKAISKNDTQDILSKYKPSSNLVEVASSAGSFKTLLAAASAAGLVETLSNEGPFTVFAPTDEAFAKVPAETLEALLADKDALTQVLLYHVVSGKRTDKSVVSQKMLKTLQGQNLDIMVDSSGAKIDNAKIITTNIMAANGIIHVIDSVMLPENLTINQNNNMKNIVATAQGAGTFNTLLTAATAAGLVDTLSNGGPFTVFAPTDEAFAKLPAGTVDSLLKDKELLSNILLYHVVSGKVMAKDVIKLTQAEALNGQKLMIDTSSGVKINDSMVTATDIMAENGVIHVVDKVLLP